MDLPTAPSAGGKKLVQIRIPAGCPFEDFQCNTTIPCEISDAPHGHVGIRMSIPAVRGHNLPQRAGRLIEMRRCRQSPKSESQIAFQPANVLIRAAWRAGIMPAIKVETKTTATICSTSSQGI